jgi:hypothetical protein
VWQKLVRVTRVWEKAMWQHRIFCHEYTYLRNLRNLRVWVKRVWEEEVWVKEVKERGGGGVTLWRGGDARMRVWEEEVWVKEEEELQEARGAVAVYICFEREREREKRGGERARERERE